MKSESRSTNEAPRTETDTNDQENSKRAPVRVF